ncbi:hypothetical protein CBR_g74649 [Chara braunii]|uniref:Uncharacterized protein n=1 Tax=Chara braunii TaxID=69332 RepID=A0A388KAB9_CHABU|nr:hypothetical protein CBR_g74649 [Chara braunii]|eukprot:GBG66961.1 hypothetical protein CBR_g74649 [Chara braunii]
MPGCGAVVFLSDDNGLSWYCCGGVEKSEAGRFTYDGRKFRTFFLTSVYDREGKNWVKEDKKVSLDHRLFQGYGVKALSMKEFDVRGNGTEFQMLDPEKFLSKTDGYCVTGSLPVVDSAFMLSRPLVQFNSPTDQLAAFVMRYREEFARLPAAQQVHRVFVPIDAPSLSAAGAKWRQDQPAGAGGKRKQLATAPPSSAAVVQALPAPVPPSDRQARDAAEQYSEATDYDNGAVPYRAGPQHRSRGGAGAFDDEECEGQDGEGGGWDGEGGGEEGEGGGEEEEGGGEGDDGNEGDAEGEDDGMDEERDDVGEEVEDNRSSQFHRRHQNESRGRCEDDACCAGDAVDAGGQPAASRGISQSYDHAMRQGDEPGSRGKRKRGEASTSPASRTKQARADAVNEARGALMASQEAWAPRKTGGGGRSGSRGGSRNGGRKGSQRSRAPELRDSGDEGEGVGPRMPEDIEELVQHATPVDTTRCFFLEYDEQGFARQDVQVVNVDVNRIKPIPRGKILFNQRSLFENIVRGIESAIESSISADPGVWDRLELVLTPVDPNVIVGGQGRRIMLDEFFQRDCAEFDSYAVCGQHTAEAMKRLVGKDSLAVKVYGLRTYAKVRVDFFDDDHTCGYFNVSLFDNTRENRAMMLSFQDAVRDMRQWQTTLLPVCMRSKEVMAAPVDIIAAAQKMTCRAAIVDISAANFKSAWTSQDFDALYAMMAKCCGPNWVLFFFAPQNVQSDVLRQLYRWEDIKLIPGSWKRVDRPPSDVTKYGNIATSSRDLMAIVLHAEGGDLKKVTVAPRLENDLTEVHVVEEKFGKCLGKHGGVEGDESAAYSIWEREPGKLWKLCSSFVGEAEGVLLLGRAHAGLLEYSHKFYELQSSPSYGKIDWKVERAASLESMDVDSREDVAAVPEAATGNMMGEQREDGGTTLGVTPPLPETGNTPAGKNTIGAISVAMGDTSQGEKVSLHKPTDAGATYGSLLATGATLAGTSEMVSESTVGMGVTGMSLHPPTCTSKGDAHCTTTPPGGVTGDDGNGGNAGGSPRSRNIEDMTTDDEDGVEGGKGVSDPIGVENEG